MHFVNADRGIQRIVPGTRLHPVVVMPGVVQVPDYRGGLRWDLVESGKRVGFDEHCPMVS